TEDAGAAAAALAGNPHFTAAEKKEILDGSYALLLVWAEAVAQPLEAEDRRQQAREALAILDRARQLRTPTQAYHLRRAGYLAWTEEKKEAEKELAQARALAPADAVDFFLLGDEAYQRKDLAQASACFQAALRSQPDHFWAEYFLAVCQLRLEQPDLAEASLT